MLWGLRVASKMVEMWQNSVPSIVKSRRVVAAEVDGSHLWSPRATSMSNGLAIQRDMLARVFSNPQIQGCLMLTSSVYLDVGRALEWIRKLPEGTQWAAIPRPSPRGPIATGGVMYASREGAERLLGARYLQFGVLQDVAITRWLSRSGTTWHEVPFVEASVAPNCPLCIEPTAVAALCTQHPDRSKEGPLMQWLHEHHKWAAVPN